MPALQTHYTFAKEESQNKEREHFDALVLGSQGPDPFFFYGMLPWRRRENGKLVNGFGVGLHHKDITPLYVAMMKYASNSEDKELLFDFIEGILLHYVLDRNCHPYVFSVTGYGVTGDDEKKNKYYTALHTKIESAIDKIYAKSKGVYNEYPKDALKISDDDLMKISKMIYEANKESEKDPNIKEDSFFCSVKDYRAVMRFINKPHFIKRLFLRIVFGKDSIPFALNYPRNLDKTYGKVDFLNEGKAAWLDPVSGKKRNESFYELMENAKEEYEKVIIPLVARAKNNEDISSDLHAFYSGIDHDGAKEGKEKKYMSPLFPYKK